jgi:GMP synthase (glutamine-hydrolysing)
MTIEYISDKILIIDFGSQVTQLIARRIREFGIYSEIFSNNTPLQKIIDFKPKGIIFSGGPASVTDDNAPTIDKEIFSLNIPILGICYGQQLICHLLGGKVEKSITREFGRAQMKIEQKSLLFEDLWETEQHYNVWMSHGDRVEAIPEEFQIIATTEHSPYAIIADENRKIYGVQFHPEVTHTGGGEILLKNFAKRVAGCDAQWTTHNFIEHKITEIKQQVGTNNVICAVSGGVDSSVVAALLNKAIHTQLQCIFVNTGLLRKNEPQQVKEIFAHLDIPLNYVDASELFLSRLQNIDDPEQKRKIIGGLFIDVFEEQAKKVDNAKFLAQGTLYSDVVESSSLHGATIKSHHNVGGLPARMNMSLIEPLREIFKDEVRKVGKELGLPDHIIDRHPFPGPGLAIRIPGAITKEKVEILQQVDDIYISELKRCNLYHQIWQAFALLLPVKSVGVMGDGRTYEYVCALRAVTSFDGMSADFFDFPHEFLQNVSNKIINSVKGVNRIVYDITSKPPGTIEWE